MYLYSVSLKVLLQCLSHLLLYMYLYTDGSVASSKLGAKKQFTHATVFIECLLCKRATQRAFLTRKLGGTIENNDLNRIKTVN